MVAAIAADKVSCEKSFIVIIILIPGMYLGSPVPDQGQHHPSSYSRQEVDIYTVSIPYMGATCTLCSLSTSNFSVSTIGSKRNEYPLPPSAIQA